ncbi:FecR domain-containing protein [Pseudomonas japonica]|uniref:FecR domain-containing protein n=1 Tax=Pseudomonas japonica TaxID=256466 RepID=UPI003A86BFE8
MNSSQLAALRQAAEWLCQLNSGEAQPSDHAAWQRWYDAAPDNAWAWLQAERLQNRVASTAHPSTARVLQLTAENRRTSRRRVIKAGVVLLGVTALGAASYPQTSRLSWLADYRSGVGEQRRLRLQNGTTVHLNTDTALDVDETGGQPRLYLRQGEIMVDVPAQQQCQVQTRHGLVDAQRCRFSVRLFATGSRLDVHAQQARATLPSGQSLTLGQAQGCQFDDQRFGPIEALASSSGAWDKGLIIANGQPLGHFIAELSRYRPGWLRCAPEVADLSLSGTFRLDDTEQVLRAIASALPVRLERRTRYWVTVVSA